MAAIKFDEEWSRRLAVLYATPEVQRTRAAVLERLGLSGGDTAIDVGSGPGFMTRELAGVVGPDGKVLGIDVSEPMLAMAARHCEGLAQVSFRKGDVLDLPLDDKSVDGAAIMQVLAYVEDLEGALAELARVLKPGGRLVVMDTDFQALVWQARDRTLSDRIVQGYDSHVCWPDLPRILPSRLGNSGLKLVLSEAVPLVVRSFAPGGFARGIAQMMSAYAVEQGIVGESEAQRWIAGQEELDAARAFFFCMTRFLFTFVR